MSANIELQNKVMALLLKNPTTEQDIMQKLGLKRNIQVRTILDSLSKKYPVWEDDSNGLLTYGLLKKK